MDRQYNPELHGGAMQGGVMLGGGGLLGGQVKTPSPAQINFAVKRLDDLVRRARVVAERFDDSLTQFGGPVPYPEQAIGPETLASNTLSELNGLLDDGFRVIDTLEALSLRAKDLLG